MASAVGAHVEFVCEGIVLDGAGFPVSGAVVVTSAGGQAITDAHGRYRIRASAPEEARELTLCAVGPATGAPRASTDVTLPGGGARIMLDPLELGSEAGDHSWIPTFGGHPGTTGWVHALAVFDDGSGPALYAGGQFQTAGGRFVHNVARWNGAEWSALGGGMDKQVLALGVFDDGQGPALHAGGDFQSAGGATAKHLAKWDGSAWSAVASGFNGPVRAMVVHDFGAGSVLVVGGQFTIVGPPNIHSVAIWDGSTLSPLGSGLAGAVHALAVHDDGAGPRLYAGGSLPIEGNLARWNGNGWAKVGGGCDHFVEALVSYDDGAGPALFVGGRFQSAGGVPLKNIARWGANGWSALGVGTNQDVYCLRVHDRGDGPVLLAGGRFTAAGAIAAKGAAVWDGRSWGPFGSGITDRVFAFEVFDDGDGPALFAGGAIPTSDFQYAGTSGHVSRLRGSKWTPLGDGVDRFVHALEIHDDGSGEALFAGGRFGMAGGTTTRRIARWTGATWEPVAGGFDGEVNALRSHDDGSGPAIYAGGLFSHSDGQFTGPVARWDGHRWSSVGKPFRDGFVTCMEPFDLGAGTHLAVGGVLVDGMGSVPGPVAVWDGTGWQGIPGAPDGTPTDLQAFDDGGGNALYVAGGFFVGPYAQGSVFRWDGSAWSLIGAAVDGGSYAISLAVFDDGNGPALHAAGSFSKIDGVPANKIARWDGSRWHPLGSGVVGALGAGVRTLAAGNGPDGSLLFAGGYFSVAGGLAVRNIAAWDGAAWRALGRGVDQQVEALLTRSAESGGELYVGGWFRSAGDSGDSFVARWGAVR